MHKDTQYFVMSSVLGTFDIIQGEMDHFLRFAAKSDSNAVHGFQNECDLLYAMPCACRNGLWGIDGWGTYCSGTVSGVYSHLKLAITALRMARRGSTALKKIAAPSWAKSWM